MFEKVEGRRAVKFGKSIYPDPDDFKYEEILSRYGIEITFLFEDGIMVSYPMELEPNETPGDVSFYSIKDMSRVLTITENFGCIEIFGPEARRVCEADNNDQEPICTIKIIDGYEDLDKLLAKKQKLEAELEANKEDEEEEEYD